MTITLLDGPMGTELIRRGVPCPAPGWSATALDQAPEVVRQIHADYAAAGAAVHTANSFRTQPRHFPDDWRRLARKAVGLARQALGPEHRLAGSIAPLEDCYSPHLSPPHPRREHRLLADALVGEGVDLLLVETFPHLGEGLAAIEAALETGATVWASFTPGPDGELLTPAQVAEGARLAHALGAHAVLVNCLPARRAMEWLQPMLDLGLPVPVGLYANAGHAHEGLGWGAEPQAAAQRYADLAQHWIDAGATIVGGCCGTTPATIAELARRFAP